MAGFFYICEYFNITPQEFFDSELRAPQKGKELQRELGKLTPQQAEHILQVVKDLTQK